ncbi:DUF4358 domain-containing protein [uncultured Clostridium sp.]|uniref:DUF4358 domain-containing protein n=1 Tax=uncultured Clostridium sp. TaxID=59620 RepID=UPI002602CA45|nr:DUF4358 domain-containing protein [uncultured Clostridium sp.]
MRKKLILAIMSIAIIGSTIVSCGSGTNDGKNDTNQEQVEDINLEDLSKKISENVQLRPMGDITDEEAKEIFKLNLDQIESYSIKKGKVNTGLETIALIKVKKGQAEAVTNSLKEYIKSIQPFYPGEQEAVENAKILETGNYIGLFIIPDYEDGEGNLEKVVTAFEDEFK